MADSTAGAASRLETFIRIGKDLVAFLRDGALFFLAVLLVALPTQFNSILVHAGFEEGNFVGFKWKSKFVESDARLVQAQGTISSLQSQNNELLKALSEANAKVNDPKQMEQLQKLEEENKALKIKTEIVQANVSQTIDSNIPLVEKARSSDKTVNASAAASGAFSGFSCGVSSYGGTWAEEMRQKVKTDLYSIYGCSESPDAPSKDGYTGDFHTPTKPDGPWKGFAAQSAIIYYSDANKGKAEAVARDVSIRYGHRFVALRGGGQGIRPDWYGKAIVVHIREPGT